MSLSLELPQSFLDALRVAKSILSSDSRLVSQNRVDSEAEQLVIAAHRVATGQRLSRIEFFSKIQNNFPAAAFEKMLILARSRVEGQPLQYLTGFQVFLDHEYEVDSRVLIPRPETEILLTSAVSEFCNDQVIPSFGLEIGLGSGILSIELLSQYPILTMVASEVSPEALELGLKNARKILGEGVSGWERLKTVCADHPFQVWEPFHDFTNFRGLADFLITNPPYLTPEDSIDDDVLAHEPHPALFVPGSDSLFLYKSMADQAASFLKEGGYVFTEIPHERSLAILELFTNQCWDARILPDLNGRDRVLIAKLRKKNG